MSKIKEYIRGEYGEDADVEKVAAIQAKEIMEAELSKRSPF